MWTQVVPHCWPWQLEGLLQAASMEACVLRLNFSAWILPTWDGWGTKLHVLEFGMWIQIVFYVELLVSLTLSE